MSRMILPGEKKSDRPVQFRWCLVVLAVPSFVVAWLSLPLEEEHVGLLLSWLISAGFCWWCLNNLISGVYTSQQGIYKRDRAPIRYWLQTGLVFGCSIAALAN